MPQRAAAWSDAPLCVAANDDRKPTSPNSTAELGRNVGFDESRNMCWPDADSAVADSTDVPTNSSAEDARRSLAQADALTAAGRISDAVLALRVVERILPRVQDRIALRRGELLRRSGMPEQACEAFALAIGSPDRGVAAHARIESAFCRLEAGDRKGEAELLGLLKAYPQLSQREALLFELAQARERWGNAKGAVASLRSIDLEQPGSPTAAQARAELARLAEAGVPMQPYSDRERVERVGRMLRWAPIEQTSAEIAALLADPKLGVESRAQVLLLALRVARLEGRWDDAQDIATRARLSGAHSADLSKLAVAPTVDAAAEQAAVERQIRSIRGGKPIARVGNGPLRALFELAIEHGRKDLCDETLDAMRTRRGFQPALRFDSAIRASGLADDAKLAALLQTLLEIPAYRVSARYHYARALERLGRLADAEAEYTRVTACDRGATPYYAMWADLRLWSMHSQTRETCIPQQAPILVRSQAERDAAEGAADQDIADGGQLTEAADTAPTLTSRALVSSVFKHGDSFDPQRGASGGAAIENPALRRQRAIALLAPIAERYGEAFPWIGRAQDLAELELWSEAADELSETYLAFRDAKGALRMRSGLLALLTGNAPPRRAASFAVIKARRALDAQTRFKLSEAATILGDPGIALRFGSARESERPRAYAELVEGAARKYGLDPNLLFAVMRVESIYNRRIVSNVGAVGLMQIMPGTGQRIAYQLGVEDFDPIRLLDPQVNLEFAAWYLASLLKRFDGRLPLAIASYNGGPHNVRLWMHKAPANIPLDAFLERIPFSQTHRYVRRVLSYYAAYRAQQDLPMTRLSVELPQLAPDEIAF